MSFNDYILLASVLLFCFFIKCSHGGTKSPCPQSVVDIASIHITKCPQNRKEMEDRSKTFKCENRQQNCTTANLYKYHCVLNSKGDGYIELCAPEVEIIGRRCTEFTTGGKFLQEHFESRCATCPFKYNSSESYKYDECYKLEFPRNRSSERKEKATKFSKNKQMVIVTQNGVRPINDAVKDTKDVHPNFGSDDEDSIHLPVVITLACTLPMAIILILLLVYKLSLHEKMCHSLRRQKGDGTSDVCDHEHEKLSTKVTTNVI